MQGEKREYRPKKFPGVVVTIKSPTERERRALGRLAKSDDEYAETVIRNHVLSVEGHEHRGRKPTTPEAFVEYGDTYLVADIAEEVLLEASLTVGESKPSGEPSGSSKAESSTEGSGTV